jgi:pilus assembly protein CpaE
VSRIVRTLVAVDPALDVESIAGSVPEGEGVHVVGVFSDLDEARAKLTQLPFDLLVVASHGYSDRTLLLVDAAHDLGPDRSVLVLSAGSSNGYVRRLLEAGADDILMMPQTRDQVGFAIKKIVARRETAGAGRGVELARMVVILGPKGGTGKTLTAANLAAALARQGRGVTVVDIDLQFGDIALTMGLAPEHTFYDLALAGGSLDIDKLDHYLMKHDSGAKALLAPARPDQASVVSAELLRDVYALLRLTNEFVIIDTPPGFTPEVITSVDASTDLIMVGMLDSLSLKNTKLGLETLGLMGYQEQDVKLVLNRAHSRVGISTSDVVAVLGREPDIFVPSDREIPRAINEGVPIVMSKPDSDAAQSFLKLADLVSLDGAVEPMTTIEPETTEQAVPKRRLFGRRS